MTAEAQVTAGAPSHVESWHDINWSKAIKLVRRLQTRIVKATQEGRWNKVKALQRLLTHSFYAKILAVKRVTENRGKKTPGVDGQCWSTPKEKLRAVGDLKDGGYQPRPLKRVYIPKKNGQQRILGIPTMHDRAMQALHLLGLDPISETLADANSYGFRRKRCAHDAIEQCFNLFAHKCNTPLWILEADIKSCFDTISHNWLESTIPMDKGILRKWLKAGYVEAGAIHPTENGTPQGGIISPVLANMALDGLEGAIKSTFRPYIRGGKRTNPKVHFVRYADDFIITGTSQCLLEEEVKPLLEVLLARRGLQLSTEKTRITHIRDGFDFLGFNVRKYGEKLLIKPAKQAIKDLQRKISDTFSLRKAVSAHQLIGALNPIIQGWGMYYRHVVSKQIFNRLDNWLWHKTFRWSRRRHGDKSTRWVLDKYFCRTDGRQFCFFGENFDGKQKFLRHLSEISIRRHIKIRSSANPYAPSDELYFESRQEQKWRQEQSSAKLQSLYRVQKGLCPLCREHITLDTGWNLHHIVAQHLGGSDLLKNLILLHPVCHRQLHAKGINVEKSRAEMCVIKA